MIDGGGLFDGVKGNSKRLKTSLDVEIDRTLGFDDCDRLFWDLQSVT